MTVSCSTQTCGHSIVRRLRSGVRVSASFQIFSRWESPGVYFQRESLSHETVYNTGSRRTRRGCSSWLTISLKHKDELWQPSRQLLHQPVFLVDSENELLLTIISTEQSTVLINSRGVREWLSAFPFLPIPISFNTIPIPKPTKRMFPFTLFSHIHIPIPSHSHSRLLYIND